MANKTLKPIKTTNTYRRLPQYVFCLNVFAAKSHCMTLTPVCTFTINERTQILNDFTSSNSANFAISYLGVKLVQII